jgi:hypothetical protein
LSFSPPVYHTNSEIDFIMRHSDGTTDGSAALPRYYVFGPAGGAPVTSTTMLESWTMPYTEATGAAQWIEFEILRPNPVTVRTPFSMRCAFWAGGGENLTVSPQAYDCIAAGDQTFTFSGDITAVGAYSADPRTVTYHWLRWDGSVSPDHTATFPQGVTRLAAQPDTVTINHANLTKPPSDTLVETDAYGHLPSVVPIWPQITCLG